MFLSRSRLRNNRDRSGWGSGDHCFDFDSAGLFSVYHFGTGLQAELLLDLPGGATVRMQAHFFDPRHHHRRRNEVTLHHHALRRGSRDLQMMLPFGIFLGIGSIVSLLLGTRIIEWYASQFR